MRLTSNLVQNPTKTEVDKFDENSEISKIIRHPKVIDGKVMGGRTVEKGFQDTWSDCPLTVNLLVKVPS